MDETAIKVKQDLKTFIDDLPQFKARALAKQGKADSKENMADTLEWFKSDTFNVGLSFNDEPHGLVGTMSVSMGTPDEIKVPLMQAAMVLSGQKVKPTVGNRCVYFSWVVAPTN